jgi:HSP20 family molecular chaperone IbpA
MVPQSPFGSHFNLPVRKQIIPTAFFGRDVLFNNLTEVADQFWNELFGHSQRAKDLLKAKGEYPKADVIVFNDRIQFDIAVPGILKKDLVVEFDPEQRLLTIAGDSTINYTFEDSQRGPQISPEIEAYGHPEYIVRELKHSKFQRSWILNDEFDLSEDKQIESLLENGLLRINIPLKGASNKKTESQKVKIEIKDNINPQESRRIMDIIIKMRKII